jgi:hypothetical protein
MLALGPTQRSAACHRWFADAEASFWTLPLTTTSEQA